MAEPRPAWYWHASYVVALLVSLQPVIKEWWRPGLISLADAQARAQGEIDAMTRLAFTAPITEPVIFEDARGRYAFRVYPDESVIQQRKYPDGREAYRYVPSLRAHEDRKAGLTDLLVTPLEASQQNTCDRFGHGGQPVITQRQMAYCRVIVRAEWSDRCFAEREYQPCHGTFSSWKFHACYH